MYADVMENWLSSGQNMEEWSGDVVKWQASERNIRSLDAVDASPLPRLDLIYICRGGIDFFFFLCPLQTAQTAEWKGVASHGASEAGNVCQKSCLEKEKKIVGGFNTESENE